jgi:hypothetical protein
MSLIEDKFVALSAQLHPTGRAFRMHPGGNRERLYKALARTEREMWDTATNILDVLLPDNDRFTTEDAADWERRLGMISNPDLDLEVRKMAIARKMSAPGSNPARGHYLWIQQQLQNAGFPVYVYENIPATNPAVINPLILSESQHGDTRYHGMQSHYINHIVVNSLDNVTDINFDIGSSLRSTFFIGGNPLGTYANVPAAREKEFRQLILNLKQSQNAAILFVHLI